MQGHAHPQGELGMPRFSVEHPLQVDRSSDGIGGLSEDGNEVNP
jgi:hypothetical protein